MTTFTTTITAMYTLPQVEGQTDVVVDVVYAVTGVQDAYTAFVSGSQEFTVTQGAGFTPYADLTEAQVIGWLNPSDIANCQVWVQGQIDSMMNAPVSPSITALPWSA